MRRRIITIAASVLGVMALTAGTTLALNAGTLDQKQELIAGGSSNWLGSMTLAQTFTPSITGPLNEVDLYITVVTVPNVQLDVAPAAPGSLSVQIVTTDPGDHFPTATVVESASISPSGDAAWIPVSFSSPQSVTAGVVYGIVLTPTSGFNLGWLGTCSADAYDRGEALVMDVGFGWRTMPNWASAHEAPGAVYCQRDFAFREYVTVAASTPPPTTTAPPTSTAAPTTESGQGPSPLLLGGLSAGVLAAAAAAAFVVRRHDDADRA